MIEDYLRLVSRMLPHLNADNYDLALRIASLPDAIRGFGHIKDRSRAAAKRDEQRWVGEFFAVSRVTLNG